MNTQLRKEEEKNKRYNSIMKAAEKLILEKGIDGFNMRTLAHRTSLSVGSIYIHFQNQDDLFLRIAIKYMRKMYKSYFSLVNTNDKASKQMRDVIKGYINFVKDNHKDFELITELNAIKKKDIQKLSSYSEFEELTISMTNLLAEIIKKGRKDGSFKKQVDLTTSLAILMSIDAVMADYHNRNSQPILEKIYGVTADELMNSYLNIINKLVK